MGVYREPADGGQDIGRGEEAVETAEMTSQEDQVFDPAFNLLTVVKGFHPEPDNTAVPAVKAIIFGGAESRRKEVDQFRFVEAGFPLPVVPVLFVFAAAQVEAEIVGGLNHFEHQPEFPDIGTGQG